MFSITYSVLTYLWAVCTEEQAAGTASFAKQSDDAMGFHSAATDSDWAEWSVVSPTRKSLYSDGGDQGLPALTWSE